MWQREINQEVQITFLAVRNCGCTKLECSWSPYGLWCCSHSFLALQFLLHIFGVLRHLMKSMRWVETSWHTPAIHCT